MTTAAPTTATVTEEVGMEERSGGRGKKGRWQAPPELGLLGLFAHTAVVTDAGGERAARGPVAARPSERERDHEDTQPGPPRSSLPSAAGGCS